MSRAERVLQCVVDSVNGETALLRSVRVSPDGAKLFFYGENRRLAAYYAAAQVTNRVRDALEADEINFHYSPKEPSADTQDWLPAVLG